MHLTTCLVCDEKKDHEKNVLGKPIIREDLNACTKFDRICFESQKYGQLSSQTLTYLEQLSKFVQLCALRTKRVKGVTKNLVDNFCIFGAPAIFQRNNGREFNARVVRNIFRCGRV